MTFCLSGITFQKRMVEGQVVTAFNSHLMHLYVKMVLDNGLIVGSTSYEQELQATRHSGVVEMLL
jgi:hypothetical protein